MSRVIRTIAIALASLASINAQSRDLYDPTVLRVFQLTFKQANWQTLLTQNYSSKTYIAADLTIDGVTYPDVGVRYKGNSSYSSSGAKKPLKIDMEFTDPAGEVLGYSKLTLNNQFKDPSFVREVVTYELMRDYVPTPKANFVTVTINGQNWGVFTNVEQVNSDFMKQWFADDDGNRYKGDAPGGSGPGGGAPRDGTAMIWLGSGTSPYQLSYELKTENSLNPWTDLIAVCNQLNNTATAQLPAAIEPILHVDRALWHLALNNLFVQNDSYIGPAHNFYLLQDDFHGRMSIIHWDVNEAFGVFSLRMSISQLERLDPLYGSTNVNRPLMSKLVAVPEYRNRYLAHMRTALGDFWNWQTMLPLINRYQNLIRTAVQNDPNNSYTFAQFSSNVTSSVGSIPGLEPFVRNRESFLNSSATLQQTAPTISTVSLTPAVPTAAQSPVVTARITATTSVHTPLLYYRMQGAFVSTPMFDDGMHGDGGANDSVFGASIPAHNVALTVEYYVGAEATAGGMSFAPATAEQHPESFVVAPIVGGNSIVINEWMADNETTILDPSGAADDWIELWNPKSSAIDASGMFLTDDPNDPTQWQIPSGSTIAAGGSLLIWADNETTQGVYHANFKLSASGEEILLFASDGQTLLDSVQFGDQEEDISTGRLDDGSSLLVTFIDATPAAPNGVQGCGTRRYSALDVTTVTGDLAITGVPRIGSTVSFGLSGMEANATGYLMVGLQASQTPLGFSPAVLLVSPPLETFSSATASSSGDLNLPFSFPNDPGLIGVTVFLQGWSVSNSGLIGTNGLVLGICP